MANYDERQDPAVREPAAQPPQDPTVQEPAAAANGTGDPVTPAPGAGENITPPAAQPPQPPAQPPYTPAPYRPQPSGGLPPKTKVFITVMIIISCLVVIFCGITAGTYLVESYRDPSGSSSTPTSSPNSPGVTLDDLIMKEDGENLSPSDAYKKVQPSAVSIKTYLPHSSDVHSEGSGMFISEKDGQAFVLTCEHVISGASSVTVIDSSGRSYQADVVAADVQTDIAILSINATGVQVVEFANGNDADIGSFVMAIGNPTGEQLASSITFGVLSGKQRSSSSDSYNTLLQFDAAVSPGNSGGMLINLKGQVIGLVTSKIASLEYEGIGFAVPSDEVLTVVAELTEYGYVRGRVRLGLSITEYSDTVVQERNLPGKVVVAEVVPGTDAEAKGVRVDDILVSVDGVKVTSSDQIIRYIRTKSPTDTIRLELYRETNGAGETVILTISLYEFVD